MNTDPTKSPAFVSIGQDPTKPAGWNVVTLADGTKAKFAGYGQWKLAGGTVVNYIELNTPDLQDTFAGPVLTQAVADAILAVAPGEVIPAIAAPVDLDPSKPAPAVVADTIAQAKQAAQTLPPEHQDFWQAFLAKIESWF